MINNARRSADKVMKMQENNGEFAYKPSLDKMPSIEQNLTFRKLFMYFGIHDICLDEQNFRQKLGFLTADGKYNRLAHLLSDDSGVSIRVAVILGKTRADRVYCVRDFGHQCLLLSLEQILMYGDTLNILQTELSDRPARRREKKLFDNRALRAAVVNALEHNDWAGGSEPMITVFSNRIEILSRGGLPEGQTRSGMFAGEPVPANRGLAEIFGMLHISGQIGTGVAEITRDYGEKAFDFRDNSLVVTIPYHWLGRSSPAAAGAGSEAGEARESSVPGKTAAMRSGVPGAEKNGGRQSHPASAASSSMLTPTQKKILRALKRNPHLTKTKLADRLNVGKTTVDQGIAALKNNGLIERVGSNKTGYWNVLS